MLKKLEAAWKVFMGLAYVLLMPFFSIFLLVIWLNDVVNALNKEDSN